MPDENASQLSIQQKAEIVKTHPALKQQMMGVLKEYPDAFYIAVHNSNEVYLSGTTGSSENVSVWLIRTMVENPAFLEYFDQCVGQAKEIRAKS